MEEDATPLDQCEEAIRLAEASPRRHDEYKGSDRLMGILYRVREKLRLGQRLSHQDDESLTEIIMLTEKWVGE